jgi:hypothetical protein
MLFLHAPFLMHGDQNLVNKHHPKIVALTTNTTTKRLFKVHHLHSMIDYCHGCQCHGIHSFE